MFDQPTACDMSALDDLASGATSTDQRLVQEGRPRVRPAAAMSPAEYAEYGERADFLFTLSYGEPQTGNAVSRTARTSENSGV